MGRDYKRKDDLDDLQLTVEGLTFLQVIGKMPMCSPNLTFKGLSVSQ